MIPLAPIERIAKKAGATRISAGALKEVQKLVEDIGKELVQDTSQAARYSKRKTILGKDIKFVAQKQNL